MTHIPIESLIPENISLLQYINHIALNSDWARSIFLTGARYVDHILVGVVIVYSIYRLLQKQSTGNALLPLREIVNICWLAGAVSIGLIISNIAKTSFAVPRPFLVADLPIQALYHFAGFNAFPSGHAITFTIITGMLWHMSRPLSIFSGIMTFYICISRVGVGIHYPFDMLVGVMIGIIVVRGSRWLMHRI